MAVSSKNINFKGMKLTVKVATHVGEKKKLMFSLKVQYLKKLTRYRAEYFLTCVNRHDEYDAEIISISKNMFSKKWSKTTI